MVTVLTQIAAEADTSRVPDSGPTVTSRTTVMSGNAIRDAAAKIRAAMEPGVRLHEIPATPERVWAALRAKAGSTTTDR